MNNINLQQEIPYCPTPENLYFYNPVQPGNELHYGFNPYYNITGYHYDKEMFYIIDFYGIKKNKYVISSYGRIFTFTTGKEMSSSYSAGYRRICLRMEQDENEHGRRFFGVHRLVAMAFIPKTLEDLSLGRDIVNHKDTIRSNNYYKNLEWCTEQENTIHAFEANAHGKTQIFTQYNKESEWGKRKTGERIGMCRVTDEQVHIICQNLIQGKSREECCIAAGLEPNDSNRTIVSNIAGGHRRGDIASQYGITKENKRTKDLKDRSEYIPAVVALLKEGHTIKRITELLPLDENYDRARMFVSGIKKKVSEGKL